MQSVLSCILDTSIAVMMQTTRKTVRQVGVDNASYRKDAAAWTGRGAAVVPLA